MTDMSIDFGPGVLAAIDDLCGFSDTETGGVLVGSYPDHLTAAVTEALPPPRDSEHYGTEFVRGTLGLRELLEERWNASPRTYYVGEWHYHPAPIVEPSAVDFATMRGFAADPAIGCPCPIMVIACRRSDGTRPIRAWTFIDGEPVEIALDAHRDVKPENTPPRAAGGSDVEHREP